MTSRVKRWLNKSVIYSFQKENGCSSQFISKDSIHDKNDTFPFLLGCRIKDRKI